MSKYDEFTKINNTNAPDPLSPPLMQDSTGTATAASTGTESQAHSAFSIVKNKIFQMYKIHQENKKDNNK